MRNLDDFNKSKDELDEVAPYNYEEYCKKVKTSKKNNNKGIRIISIFGISFLVVILIYFIGISSQSKSVEEVTRNRKSDEKEIVLVETWDKGIGLQLNDISIDGNKLSAEMTLNYKDLDKSFIDTKEKNFEISTKGYFEIYIGDTRLKTFSPSIESNFSENKTEITVKSDLSIEEFPSEPFQLRYICKKLEIIYSATKSSIINGQWGFSYNIDSLSDIEHEKTLKIEKMTSLVNDDVNIEVDFDYLVFKDDMVDLVYRYENKSKEKLNNKYNLEFKIFNEFGAEIGSLSSIINSENDDKVKRSTTFNLGENLKEFIIIPKITKNTILSKSKTVVEGTPIKVDLSDVYE